MADRPMHGESIEAYRARRKEEMASGSSAASAPAPSSPVKAGPSRAVAPPPATKDAATGKAIINIDRAADVEDRINVSRKSAKGGIKALDMDAIAAADAEVNSPKKFGKTPAQVAQEREEGARLIGRSRFDVDRPAEAPAAPQKTSVKAAARPAAPVTTSRAAPAKAAAPAAAESAPGPGLFGSNLSAPKAAPSVRAEAPSPAVPSPAPSSPPAANPAPMAPAPGNTPSVPEPVASAQGPRYGRPEGGQGTLFGTTGYKRGPRTPEGKSMVSERFNPGAETESPSGPGPGQLHMITGTGRVSPNAKDPNYKAPAPKARAAAPVVSEEPVQAVAKDGPAVRSRRVTPASPGSEGAGDVQTGHVEHLNQAQASKAAPGSVAEPRGSRKLSGGGIWDMPGVRASAPSPAPAPAVPSSRPARAGRTGEAPRSPETGGGRTNAARSGTGINVSGDNSSHTVTVTHNYNYGVVGDVGGDVHGNIGGGGAARPSGGGAGGPRGRAAGGSPRGGSGDSGGGGGGRPPARTAGHREHGPDAWIDLPATGHHSLRGGYEHVTGQRDSGGHMTNQATRAHTSGSGHAAQSHGPQQNPIGGSGRHSGGSTGTGTNFNWTGPQPTFTPHPASAASPSPSGNGGLAPMPAGSVSGASAPGHAFASGNGTAQRPGAPKKTVRVGGLNWDED